MVFGLQPLRRFETFAKVIALIPKTTLAWAIYEHFSSPGSI